MRAIRRAMAVVALAVIVPACSVLLDKSADQCAVDGDCARFPGTVCVARACVASPLGAAGAANEQGGSGGGGEPSGGGSGGAAPSCSVAKPMTNDEIMNYPCTNATCFPFDNCARVGLCDGGALPALVAPPTGGAP